MLQQPKLLQVGCIAIAYHAAIASAASSSSSSPMPGSLIIAITVVSSLTLLLIIALIVILVHRCRKQRHTSPSVSYPSGPSRFSWNPLSYLPSGNPLSRKTRANKAKNQRRTFSASSAGIFFVPKPIQKRSTGWGYDFPEDEPEEEKLEDCPVLPPPPTPSPPPPPPASTWPTVEPTMPERLSRNWSTRLTRGWSLRFPSIRQSRHERLRMLSGGDNDVEVDAFAANEKRVETWG